MSPFGIRFMTSTPSLAPRQHARSCPGCWHDALISVRPKRRAARLSSEGSRTGGDGDANAGPRTRRSMGWRPWRGCPGCFRGQALSLSNTLRRNMGWNTRIDQVRYRGAKNITHVRRACTPARSHRAFQGTPYHLQTQRCSRPEQGRVYHRQP